MTHFPPALEHSMPVEVFPNLFLITGAMETVINDTDWKFSRNMIIVRQGEDLILINTIRLDSAGLEALSQLGNVRHIFRLGALHGRDDAFYKHTFDAKLWAPEGVLVDENININHFLTDDCECALDDSRVFCFRTTQLPESILHIDRHGGILIACDALQNWESPDQYFSEASLRIMSDLGYFQRANYGPLWKNLNQPAEEDFLRLEELSFDHVLCGHGRPLLGGAKMAFAKRREEAFHIKND
jgi:hypothetical protein